MEEIWSSLIKLFVFDDGLFYESTLRFKFKRLESDIISYYNQLYVS